jgi:hypothetical protein
MSDNKKGLPPLEKESYETFKKLNDMLRAFDATVIYNFLLTDKENRQEFFVLIYKHIIELYAEVKKESKFAYSCLPGYCPTGPEGECEDCSGSGS